MNLGIAKWTGRPILRALCASVRRFEAVFVPVPIMGDSISDGTVSVWKKNIGDQVDQDELVAVIDTDKISAEVLSPVRGRLAFMDAIEGDTVLVGNRLFVIETDSAVTIESAAQVSEPAPQVSEPAAQVGRREERIPMNRIRQRIAERLKGAQKTGVLLTTFQECDMGPVMELRKKLGPAVQQKFGCKLGFMSFFMAASTDSLQKYPLVNGFIEDKNVVSPNYVDLSIAVATPSGLTVPVIRDVEKKSLIDLEKELAELAKSARNNQLTLEQMAGGTFTISNGGVYGSMMSTPIINPPQSAILGMHSIVKRAMVDSEGKVVVKPIMYLALTYDHRLIDGKDAVGFLKNIVDKIENPLSLLPSDLN